MNSLQKRVVISVTLTTLLHASIFYTLSGIEQPKIAPKKNIEITLFQAPKQEKKAVTETIEEKPEEPTPKTKPEPVVEPEPEPEPVVEPKPEPEPVVQPEPTVKPKPVVKPKPKPKPKPVAKPKPKPKPIKVSKKKTIKPKEANTSSKKKDIAANEDTRASNTNANILEAYLYKVRVKIQRNLRYPALARRLKIQGESIVAFKILSDGSVDKSSIAIQKSSGNKSLDTQAINTILQVSPFAAPPKGKISIIVPVAFNLK